MVFLDSTKDGNFSVGSTLFFLEIDFSYEKNI